MIHSNITRLCPTRMSRYMCGLSSSLSRIIQRVEAHEKCIRVTRISGHAYSNFTAVRCSLLKNHKIMSISLSFPIKNVPCIITKPSEYCSDSYGQFVQNRSIVTSSIKNNISKDNLRKSMDQLTDQFMEARELIEDARESMETVYFSEDMADAQAAVKETLEQYQKLLAQLSEDQKQEVLRTIGLKMEELKAQEQAIKEQLHDH